jgi:pimeloyl-ACP methyl ester carboxylesterase
VLLYLGIGGPGAGGFPASTTSLRPLEEHFVVVNWDQPGTGKSYGAAPTSSLTVDRIVEDGRALTELLRDRFGQDKIYLLGLSWGTILGTKLVHRYPELYRAYVGMGQMVNTTENDRFGYDLAVKLLDGRGEAGAAEALRRNGPPPYDGDGMALKYAAYNNVLFDHMGNARLELVLTLVPQLAPEYGFVDRLNFDRGLVESFTTLYPQLRDLDFTTEAPELEVPMFFLAGRNDVNAVAAILERYVDQLRAPHKEIIWLESGHGAGPEEILDAMLNHVLPVVADRASAAP